MAKFYDTLLGEYVKNPGRRWLKLDTLAEDYFDYQMISYDEISQKKKLNFSEVELKNASVYSGEDVYMTHMLYEKQKSEGLLGEDVLMNMELPLIEAISSMELTGVKIDRDTLKGIGMRLENATRDLEKEIYDIAWVEFNIKSPKQVWEVLFEKLELPKGKKTKTWYSVSADVLNNLSHEFPIAAKIVKYRHYSKLLGTYIEWLLNIATDNDLIHTSYNQAVTSTWRLSSTNPNLQNIPSWWWVAGEIRSAFIPHNSGDKIVAFDYSQVEVRILAMMSGDENLLHAFREGLDIHQTTAEFIFEKTDISGAERKIAKAVNFGVIYGISPFGLSKNINISQKDAKVYIDWFYSNYPKVRSFFDDVITKCEETWYVQTLFGRKRYIKSINDKNKMIKSWAEREAINMPIQWTSADIIKIAMLEIHNLLKNYKSTMMMQVHDELVFNIVPEEFDELTQKIPEIMESILVNFIDKIVYTDITKENFIPLKVDAGIGDNWKEAK